MSGSGTDYTQTPNWSFYKPVVDADEDQWGFHINFNTDLLDTILDPAGSTFLPVTGGTLTGPLTLPGPPVVSLQAATKDYVDAAIAAIPDGASITVGDAPPALTNGALWFCSTDTQLYVGYVDPTGPGQWVVANNTGMSGSYLPLSGGTMSGPLNWTSTGSTTSRAAQDRTADVANVLDFGADPTGATDSTTAIRAAIATTRRVYVPAGMYRVTDVISLLKGQIMYGDGRLQSMLRVNSTSFNLSAVGVVQMYQGEPSSQLVDIGIGFIQPDVASRASLVVFPPAIYAQGAQRGKLVRVRIEGAHVGIDARRNTVLTIEDLECGAISKGMIWGSLVSGDGNGAKDFNHWAKVQFFPFGFPAGTNLGTVYNDATTVAAEIGEIDGLMCSGFSAYNGRVVLTADASNHTYSFVNLSLDAPGGVIDIQGSPMICNFTGLVLNKDTTTEPCLKVAGGQVNVRNGQFQSLGSDVLLRVTGGTVSCSGGRIYQASTTIGAADVSGGGFLSLSDMTFQMAATSASFIKQSGGALSVANCHFLLAGSGVGIEYTTDTSANKLTGVSWNNKTAIIPSTTTPLGQYIGHYVPASATTYSIMGSATAPGLLLGDLNTATPYAQFFDVTRHYAVSGLTATNAGTQATALQLTRQINKINVVATANDAVKLKPSVAGEWQVVINQSTTNYLRVFTDAADTSINGIAGATGVRVLPGSTVCFFCSIATLWHASPVELLTSFAGNVMDFQSDAANPALRLGAMDTSTPYAQFFGKKRSYAVSGLTAAGSTQADALVLTRDYNRIVTVASGTGVKFLPSVAGMEYRVSNGGANPMKIYADGSDTINGTAGATGITLNAGAKGIYWCNVATAWDGGTLT